MSRHESLLAQLRTYEPADELESRHRLAMCALLTGSADPFTRAHYLPGHFTASCYIIDHAGRLLLHHHRRLNLWLQMGGHIEPEEAVDAAALREGAEESGLSDLELLGGGIFDLDIHDIPPGRGEPAHKHFDVRYLARTGQPEAITIDRAESNDLAWLTLPEAAARMPGAESHRVIDKIERMLHERSLP
jgi:8-oxo-dGTP pyrophosphatase MutT (NUDIX family)